MNVQTMEIGQHHVHMHGEDSSSENTLGEAVIETDMLFQDKPWRDLKRGLGCGVTVRPVHHNDLKSSSGRNYKRKGASIMEGTRLFINIRYKKIRQLGAMSSKFRN